MKDIFIDTNIAKNFTTPLDPEYKKLIRWLLTSSEACLVVSQKLLVEYDRSAKHAATPTSIPVVIDRLTRDGLLNKIGNPEIRAFQQAHFTKKVINKLTCNEQDREHIPVVLLSERKYALTLDDAFKHDLENFPGFKATVEKRPEHLPYAAE